MKKNHHILLTSLIMTVFVFASGIFISYWLDFERIDEINNLISQHEIDNEAFLLEENVLAGNGGITCSVMENRLESLNEEIIKVGKDLTSFGGKSIFRKNDFELLRREYFLLQLKFYMLTLDLNEKCGKTFIPIIFFYEAEDTMSERQGLILDEISDEFINQVVVISIDKDYDKEPIIPYLVEKYNVTRAPSLVIDGELVFDRLAYAGQVNGTIMKIMRKADPYAGDLDFIFNATGRDQEEYAHTIRGMIDSEKSEFVKGDLLYMLGRIEKNDSIICSSLEYYDNYVPVSKEEQALIYETYVSVGCGRNRAAFLNEAADIWDQLGNVFRADVDRKLANKKKMEFIPEPPDLESNVSGHHSIGKVIIGSSGFIIDRDDLILSQSDRVNRDWLSYQFDFPFSDNLLTVFSESLTYDEKNLQRGIGWHEGGRLSDIEGAGIPRVVASGTMVIRVNGTWYAPNENGTLMFQVPRDKIGYPTTRFLADDIAVVIDTHGVNMLVEQAMRMNATVVIGCCDNPGKIAAARYLADRGKKVICFTDKYLPLILGYKGPLLGNPPFIRNGNKVTFGRRPISIDISQKIIVSNVSDPTVVQSYYDTPARYFSELSKYADIDVFYFDFSAPNETYALVETARIFNSSVIGVRVFSYDDYLAVKDWLDEDDSHIAVMFHSYPYPFGYKLMNDYPLQTTFDDLNPLII